MRILRYNFHAFPRGRGLPWYINDGSGANKARPFLRALDLITKPRLSAKLFM